MTMAPSNVRLPGVILALLLVTASIVVLAAPDALGVADPCDAPGAIVGDDGDNVLTGTGADDVICGFGGDDIISGGGGADTIFGGSGNDEIHGGLGSDRIFGGPGADTVFGDAGHDRIWGDDGRDEIRGGPGRDRIWGGRGDDWISGDGGADRIWGDRGRDTLLGGPGADLLRGGDHADDLRGGDGSDQLFGGPGADVCRGQGGRADAIHDAQCENRMTAERLLPSFSNAGYAPGAECGAMDTSCLAWSGFSVDVVVAGYPVSLCDFSPHNCTRYVAFRLSLRGLAAGEYPQGNGGEWADVDSDLVAFDSPAVGDVAHWYDLGGSDCDGLPCGHVAYVERVGSDQQGAFIVVSESHCNQGGGIRKIYRSSGGWPVDNFLRFSP